MKLKFLKLVLFGLCFNLKSFGQNGGKMEAPKLIVGIVVDQMRYDYIYKYWDKYQDNGFKKLVNFGFNCKNAHINYIPTYTGPGHASIYTGTTPSVHGIIGNNWYDKNLNRLVYCTETLNAGEEKYGVMSPQNMLTTTIGDELKLISNFKSKVIGISLKERAAILPAGHTADAAYWLNKETGEVISSKYYMDDLPNWIQSFNAKKIAHKYLSKEWNTLLPIESYVESDSDFSKYEGGFLDNAIAPKFPYDLGKILAQSNYELLSSTPFGNDFIKDLAIETVKSENLGKGNNTDFLAISFSSTDYVGHQFGPQSIEVEDTYLRLDVALAELITFLEKQYGKDKFLLFLTADHGVSHNPDYLSDHNIPSGHFDSKLFLNAIKQHLNVNFGEGSWINNYSNGQLFLNRKLIEEKGLKLVDFENKIIDFAIQQKGISNVYASKSLVNSIGDNKPFAMVQRGFNQKRSGDLVFVLEPGWMQYGKTGTTHGTSYSYDSHVPLMWYGWKVQIGNSSKLVDVTDIAPTISTLLNMPFPSGCTGNSLEDLISK